MTKIQVHAVDRKDIPTLFAQGIIKKECIKCYTPIENPEQIAGLLLKQNSIHPVCKDHEGEVWEKAKQVIE